MFQKSQVFKMFSCRWAKIIQLPRNLQRGLGGGSSLWGKSTVQRTGGPRINPQLTQKGTSDFCTFFTDGAAGLCPGKGQQTVLQVSPGPATGGGVHRWLSWLTSPKEIS